MQKNGVQFRIEVDGTRSEKLYSKPATNTKFLSYALWQEIKADFY